ncbi:MAG: hypothetical protein WBP03_05025 [Candidatus Saccharimonadales bacterium]
MGVAIFLVFSARFASNHEVARTAAQQAAKDFGVVVFGLAWATTHFKHSLHLIKKFLAHNWRMFALVEFANIAKVSVVKRIGKNIFDLVFFEWLIATGLYTIIGKEISNILKPLIAFGV